MPAKYEMTCLLPCLSNLLDTETGTETVQKKSKSET